MYAISLQGSKREYFEDLENTFCAAPTSTAAMSGVRPHVASIGSRGAPKSTRAKKMIPVAAQNQLQLASAPCKTSWSPHRTGGRSDVIID